ncbi:unnamed protein product [Rotaria sp. Silwood1]|nr:unnamed protein product [Rotaria sp. Silwood1]
MTHFSRKSRVTKVKTVRRHHRHRQANTLPSWTYCNPSSATAAGEVKQNSDSFQCMTYIHQGQSGTDFYYDGAVGNCDYLIQMFTTIVSQTYTISYWLYNRGSAQPSGADVIINI